jgi:putative membrane protein (TIGR04086 family)
MNKIIHQNAKMFVLLKGLLISYIITAFMLLLLAFLMLKLDTPSIVISGGINFAYIISVFIGGFFTGKRMEQRKFVWGMIMGLFYFVILLLISLMMNRVSPMPIGSLFTVFIISVLSGMLGGMIS